MATPTVRYRTVLGIREFQALFGAHVVSMLGDIVAAVALTVLVYQRSRSPALAASVLALSFLPSLVTGPLASSIAERWAARPVMVVCNLASAVLVAVMTIPGLPVVALLALLLAASLIAPIFRGVRAATLPDVLPGGGAYILGRSLMRMVSQSAQVVGYALGGLLLTVATPRVALAGDAASFVAAAGWLRYGTRRRSAAGTPGQRSVARDSLNDLRAVLAHPGLRRLLCFGWLVPAFAVAPEALATPYVTHLGLPARDVGYLLCGLPIGSIVGDMIAGRLLTTRSQRRIMVPAGGLTFVPLFAFGLRPHLAVAIGLLMVSGLGFSYSAGLDGLVLDTAPKALRSQTLALVGTGLMFIQGVGFAAWGLAGQLASASIVIVAASALGVVIVIVFRPSQPAAALSQSTINP